MLLGRAQLGGLTMHDRRIRIDGRRHRAEVLAVRELERIGVLAVYVDYSRGRHGRVFTCWYRFGSGKRATPHVSVRAQEARIATDGEILVLVPGHRGSDGFMPRS